ERSGPSQARVPGANPDPEGASATPRHHAPRPGIREHGNPDRRRRGGKPDVEGWARGLATHQVGDGKAHHGRRTDSSETDAAFAEERITADTELSQEEVVGAPEEGAVRQKGEDPRNEHRQGEPT